MIVSRQEAVEIVRGKLDEVVIQYTPPAVGSCQAVQSAVGKPAICKVTITDSWPLRAGGHAVRFSLVEQIPPRLLDRRPWRGYTANPAMAMRDEGEAVSEQWLDAFSADAQWNRKQRAREELERLRAALRSAQEAFKAAGIEPSSEIRLIERRIQALSRKAA
jgi:hypothetical protein